VYGTSVEHRFMCVSRERRRRSVCLHTYIHAWMHVLMQMCVYRNVHMCTVNRGSNVCPTSCALQMVCMHIYVHTFKCACMHVRRGMYADVCRCATRVEGATRDERAVTGTCSISLGLEVCSGAWYIDIHICIYIYTYVHIYTYIYTFGVYTYIYTYVHIHI